MIITSPDNTLLVIIVILISFGMMAIFSAGAPEGSYLYNNPAYYFMKHFMYILIGLFCMTFFAKFDYKKLKNYVMPFSLVTIALIAATYIPGLGKESYGASRWLIGIPIQPSELAKIATILLVSSIMINAKTIFDRKLLLHLGLVGIMFILILKQPNLSVATIVAAIAGVLLLAGGISSLLLGGVAAAGAAFVLPHMHGYQTSRITGWLNPWADPQGTGYNLIQSWYAIGSGGIFGVGFGNSKQKLFWLPFRHTDFIFSVIAEELGLIGCLVLIGVFIAFIHRGLLIANRCTDSFGKLLALGITFAIGIQAFINIGVTVGVLPVTGVTLPLISYGGTSVVVTMIMLGVLLNISRKRIKRIQPEEAQYAV
ncbi:MAG: cell division protein FtsW [Candidatus Melainabacteria bacterium RIFOXYA12_FULL_32_12]|nr:MAG: cell division protein FtsW [Candidatus Melainabacteria bacterium RIFOXYA2_FULL_32_9]OGI24874.1 MAG: cell division protein FtsW [Candidatus Melainabacteria bacterium RIFOXYA12_FULL_32_12]